MSNAMSEPVHLGVPPEWPQPAPGCHVCAALARQRAQAAGDGDQSKVSDCNVEIHRHKNPHSRRLR